MALSVEEAFRRRVILRQLCRNYLQQARHQRIVATDVPPGVQANAMMRFADPLDETSYASSNFPSMMVDQCLSWAFLADIM